MENHRSALDSIRPRCPLQGTDFLGPLHVVAPPLLALLSCWLLYRLCCYCFYHTLLLVIVHSVATLLLGCVLPSSVLLHIRLYCTPHNRGGGPPKEGERLHGFRLCLVEPACVLNTGRECLIPLPPINAFDLQSSPREADLSGTAAYLLDVGLVGHTTPDCPDSFNIRPPWRHRNHNPRYPPCRLISSPIPA